MMRPASRAMAVSKTATVAPAPGRFSDFGKYEP